MLATTPDWTDTSGFSVFSEGLLGALHVAAHEAMDSGRLAEGRRDLERGLRLLPEGGAEWVHLQWHLMLFELLLGSGGQARARFEQHLQPAAQAGEAREDGPAGLWWLALAGEPVPQDAWRAVGARARIELERDAPAHLRLHDLLALAGAGELDTLDSWIGAQAKGGATAASSTLLHMARGLSAFARGDHVAAISPLSEALPGVFALGGFRAQKRLFEKLCRAAWCRASTNASAIRMRRAA